MHPANGFVSVVGALPYRAANTVFKLALYKRAYYHSASVGGNVLVGLYKGRCIGNVSGTHMDVQLSGL
jgi:hypothetical protein